MITPSVHHNTYHKVTQIYDQLLLSFFCADRHTDRHKEAQTISPSLSITDAQTIIIDNYTEFVARVYFFVRYTMS